MDRTHHINGEDAALQGRILRRVLDDRVMYHVSDLMRSVDLNPEDVAEVDDALTAIGELVRAGLLYKVGDDLLVVASPPASYFHSLPVYV